MSILVYIRQGSSQDVAKLAKESRGELALPFLPKVYTSCLLGTNEACLVFLWNLNGLDAVFLVMDALTRLFYRLTMSKFASYRSVIVSMANTPPHFPVDFEVSDWDFLSGKADFYHHFRHRWADFIGTLEPTSDYDHLFRQADGEEVCRGYDLRCSCLVRLCQAAPQSAERFAVLLVNEISLLRCALRCFPNKSTVESRAANERLKALAGYESLCSHLTRFLTP